MDASANGLVAFYDGHRARILIGATIAGFAILNLMWFAAALRTSLAEAGKVGWGGGGFQRGARWIFVVSQFLLARVPATRAGW